MVSFSRRDVVKSLTGGAMLGFAPQAAKAAGAAAEFYKGKTVRILVGSPPGGGYDLYARMLLPHFAQKLGATVIDEGAKSRRDINYMPGADLQELIGSLMRAAEPRVADIKRVMLNTYF